MKLVLRQIQLPLAEFTLTVDATLTGQLTSLFGPSGAGKTTLLDLVAGLRRPHAGSIELDGEVLTDRARRVFLPARRRGIGYVPQEGALFPHLSIRHNLLYGAQRIAAAETRILFDHVVTVLEIDALLDRRPHSLSGGEKQRVALGRALLSSPRLLLLDEPLAALDQSLKERILPYLLRVRDEFQVPMIYVTHNADEVMTLGDRVLVLDQGRVLREGRPTDLFVPTPQPRYVLKP